MPRVLLFLVIWSLTIQLQLLSCYTRCVIKERGRWDKWWWNRISVRHMIKLNGDSYAQWWLLILIFATHFLQVRFDQAWLPYGLNSCIIFYFYSFKHGPSQCDLWGKLRKCGFEGMGRFFSDLLHEPGPCVLLIGQGILVTPQAHWGCLISKISTLKELLCSGWLCP